MPEEEEDEDLLIERASDQRNCDQAAVLQQIITCLTPLTREDRRRIIDTVCTFLAIPVGGSGHSATVLTARAPAPPPHFLFSGANAPSAKNFLFEKAPMTDVERVACLAFYLTHYRDTPHFKTQDITTLNTEAAHRPFSNTAFAVENATKSGYLVPSVKGAKQLSAAGEQFVRALPDREAARVAIDRARPTRNHKTSSAKFSKRRR